MGDDDGNQSVGSRSGTATVNNRLHVVIHAESSPDLKHRLVINGSMQWSEVLERMCRKLCINDVQHIEAITATGGAQITDLEDFMDGDVLAVRVNTRRLCESNSIGWAQFSEPGGNSHSVQHSMSGVQVGVGTVQEPPRPKLQGSGSSRRLIPPSQLPAQAPASTTTPMPAPSPHTPAPAATPTPASLPVTPADTHAALGALQGALDQGHGHGAHGHLHAHTADSDAMHQFAQYQQTQQQGLWDSRGRSDGWQSASPSPAGGGGRATSSIGSSRTGKASRPASARARSTTSDSNAHSHSDHSHCNHSHSHAHAHTHTAPGLAKGGKTRTRPKSAGPGGRGRARKPKRPVAPRNLETGGDLELRKVPETVTNDELREIISQSIWEWAVRSGLIPRDQTKLPEDVLTSCFGAMNMLPDLSTPGADGMPAEDMGFDPFEYGTAGPGVNMRHPPNKLSLRKFTQGVREMLGLKITWSSIDSMWNRILAAYPMALPPSPKKSKFRRRLPERKTVNGMDISSGSLNAGSMFTTYGGGGGIKSAGEVIGVTKPGASYIQRQQFILAFRESNNHSQAAEPSLKKDKADKVTKAKWMDVAFGKVMDAMDRDDLLLHESFMVFDCGGDGLISVGEFIRILKKMEPPLKIDRPKMYAMFTAINANGVDRQITPADFVSFFSKLYQQRFRLLDNMARKISTDLETMKELIAEEPKGPARFDLLKEQKAHVKLLSHVQTMLRRVKLVVTAASEFLNQPQGFSMNRTGSGVGT
eukprot:CAMPEP_0119479220 /NCGR_PEP_ID=MMETSP1344-20130328/8588_1 /TAXON_ID=236787 /ORGANISM="Florenciella parvula, Strain CCMP2471" /LENGTH=758 /DNA_ID=CAMNT_0007513437 /DNA_START=52 /DNA_END=2324 /DNA_ORIENTATION=+